MFVNSDQKWIGQDKLPFFANYVIICHKSSDGHFELLDKSKFQFIQKIQHKMQIFLFQDSADLQKK